MLSQPFYDEITKSFPVDFRVLRNFGSPFPFDIYCFITRRVFSLKKTKKDYAFIPWKSLIKQMGANYKHPSSFAFNFKKNCKKVFEVWPEAKEIIKFKKDMTGIGVFCRNSHILPKSKLKKSGLMHANKRHEKTPMNSTYCRLDFDAR